MAQSKSGWGVDVKSCSDGALVEIIRGLRGSQHQSVQLDAQQELVQRLRVKRGLTTGQIVSILTSMATKPERAEIAKEWASTLGITERQFIDLAGGK